MYKPKPNLDFDHGYAIVRLELDRAKEVGIDRHIVTVKKVVRSMEVAEEEVERLNRLNADKGCLYFWEITRLERDDRDQATSHPDHATGPNLAQMGPTTGQSD